MKNVKRLLIHILMTLILITSLFTGQAQAELTAKDEVRELLRDYYVEEVSDEVLNAPTIDEMLQKLDDPHTNFFTADQYQEFNESLEQSFSGIGIFMDEVPEGAKIIGVLKGSPSEQVGLQPGDIISTGTPPGVGLGRNPQVWLKPGDVVEATVEGIGTLRNHFVAER
jgi:carboxyl-terminal processing protease